MDVSRWFKEGTSDERFEVVLSSAQAYVLAKPSIYEGEANGKV